MAGKPDFYIVTPRIPQQRPGIPNDITELASTAEQLGFDRVWIIETNDRGAFAVATQMALATSDIQIGTNVVSTFTRTPTLLAMEYITLDEVSGGRFVLGLGPGGTELVRDGHGLTFEKPLTRVRESLDIIRTLVTGERLSYDGGIFTIQKDFRLRVAAPSGKAPLYISALNPKMLELAGEKADGVILSHAPAEALDAVRERVAAGARRSDRDPQEVEICVNLPLGVDHPEAVDNLRKAVAWHLAAPTYDWLASHTPFAQAALEVRERWWSGRREEGAGLVTDDILLTFGLGYTPDQIRSRVDRYLEAGVTPIIDSHGVRKDHVRDDTIAIMEAALGTSAGQR